MADKVIVGLNSEDAHFRNKEIEQIKALREKVNKEKMTQYSEEHKYHCFRCGTESLVEVHKGGVVIDVCVNENCGAMHLDPGEIETLLEENKTVVNIRQSIFNVFK